MYSSRKDFTKVYIFVAVARYKIRFQIGYTFQSDNLAENGYQGPSDGKENLANTSLKLVSHLVKVITETQLTINGWTGKVQ